MTGIRFALEPGRGRNTVPVRSAMFGAVLAMIVLIGTVAFGDSLHTLVSHPQLYGWNWDYELLSSNGGGSNIPDPPASRLLSRDPDVAASAGVSFVTMRIGGQTVPVLAGHAGAAVGPRLLTGHRVETSSQIVVGASTLAQLHKHVGDTVDVRFGARAPSRVRIVGTATMPTIGPAGSLHLSIGNGALVSSKLLPATALTEPGLLPGPSAIFVRLRPGVDPVAARRRLQRVVAASTVVTNGPPSVVSVQRPAEIVNYRTMGSTPALLGAALAAGAVVALGLTLVTSVRRRRRDLAILKTLGFTRRQLAAAVAWQSSVAVGVGTVVGVPLGIIIGRALWNVFARELHVVPQPTVPALTIVLVAVGALVLANIVAAIPGRQAARTSTALLLRAE